MTVDSTDTSLEVQEVLDAFSGEFPPVAKTGAFQLAAALVAGAMVLLPLVYVALVALTGYAVYLHAVDYWGLAGAIEPTALGVLVYLLLLAVGVLLLVFLAKPLVARPVEWEATRTLQEGEAPVLFALVRRLSEVVGAPVPQRLEIGGLVNALAGRRRIPGRLIGRELVVQIGLPLVAGLTARQLAGVLAHELGHFRQGSAMRLSAIIRAISVWLTRLVHERDTWDRTMSRWAEAGSLWLAAVAGVARGLVWLVRRVLWALMLAGRAVSCMLTRQMELDADLYEARVAGSAVLAATMRRVTVLGASYDVTQRVMDDCWRHGGLPDDVPALIVACAEQLPGEVHMLIDAYLARAETRVLASHPAPKDRIAHVAADGAEGVFGLDRPAKHLFADFPSICRSLTLYVYRSLLSPHVRTQDLVPVADIMESIAPPDDFG